MKIITKKLQVKHECFLIKHGRSNFSGIVKKPHNLYFSSLSEILIVGPNLRHRQSAPP